MPNTLPLAGSAPLPVNILLAPPIAGIAEPAHPLHEAVHREVTRTFVDLVQSLGIPSQPHVQLATCPPMHNERRFLQVVVNGMDCRCSDELVQRAATYAAAPPLGAVDGDDRLFEWLHQKSDEPAESNPLVDLLGALCSEIVEQAPSVLLGTTQLLAYCNNLPRPRQTNAFAPTVSPPADVVYRVLCIVLDQKISIADSAAVSDALALGLGAGRRVDDIAEELIETLRPKTLALQIQEDLLRDLTLGDHSSARQSLASMRDALFFDLGTQYPGIMLEPRSDLKANSFALRVNHLLTLPRFGLNLDQVVSGLQDDLRRHSAQLFDRASVRSILERLEPRCPALVEAVRRRVSDEQLTRTLRLLLAEHISIRNTRAILEAILDFDYIVTDAAKYIVFDDRLPSVVEPDQDWLEDATNLAAFVRMALKRQISHHYTRGRSTLTVYLVDPSIEREVTAGPLSPAREQEVLDAVREEVGIAPTEGAILTTIDVRSALRRLIASEYPQLPVLAYQELSPDLNIQPISRIGG